MVVKAGQSVLHLEEMIEQTAESKRVCRVDRTHESVMGRTLIGGNLGERWMVGPGTGGRSENQCYRTDSLNSGLIYVQVNCILRSAVVPNAFKCCGCTETILSAALFSPPQVHGGSSRRLCVNDLVWS